MSRKKFSRVQLKSVSREAVYTQEKLAQRVGISGKTVSSIEDDKPKSRDY
jgi:DNA-binding XRE family transcriptional regulator|tara:strand:+ start:56 stop:205 length:150 start_codon:yes stop_codon:yes gene_type:complete